MSQFVLQLVLAKMEALDTARSLSVAIIARHGEWSELGNLPLSPYSYNDPSSYLLDSLATGFLKKAEFLEGGVDLETQALKQWFECERDCFNTNLFIYQIINGFCHDEEILSFVSKARRKIYEIIGKAPKIEDLNLRFGPGATLSDRSSLTTVPEKMESQVTLTPKAACFLPLYEKSAWGRGHVAIGRSDRKPVRGNKYFTVSKDVTKRRTCAKEPSFNVAIQLALGQALRSRMARSLIDLSHGKDIHQQLARAASLDGYFATIDLSNASDCVSVGLVQALIPEDWFLLLDSARCQFTQVNGRYVYLEKFSSMGNGFTFELETLIFLALILAIDPALCAGLNTFVYGDDIIVPASVARAVLGSLQLFGLRPNLNKTFISGVFRESCGGDYFDGMDVRPYHLKKLPNDPASLISLANGLRRNLEKVSHLKEVSRKLRAVWFSVLDSIPVPIRSCRGPESLGDIVIHDQECKWSTRLKDSIRFIKVYRPCKYKKVFLERFHPETQWSALLYGVHLSGNPEDDADRFIVPRDGVTGYKVDWIPFS